jgi:hypothetical protein
MKKFLMRFKNYQNQFKTEKQSLEHLSRLKFMENSIYKNLIGTPELYQNHQNKFKEFYHIWINHSFFKMLMIMIDRQLLMLLKLKNMKHRLQLLKKMTMEIIFT